MKLNGHAARVGKLRNAYKMLVVKIEKKPLGTLT
jgi:hypothetical protein